MRRPTRHIGALFALLVLALAVVTLSGHTAGPMEDPPEAAMEAPEVAPEAEDTMATLADDSTEAAEASDNDAGPDVEAMEEVAAPAPVMEEVPTGSYTRTELRKGERLFKGLLAFQSGLHDCASCHYPTRTDSLNWNPSAYDLAVIWKEDENYGIKAKLDSPLGMRMMTDHQGMTITALEERQLEAYFEAVLENPTMFVYKVFWDGLNIMWSANTDRLFYCTTSLNVWSLRSWVSTRST